MPEASSRIYSEKEGLKIKPCRVTSPMLFGTARREKTFGAHPSPNLAILTRRAVHASNPHGIGCCATALDLRPGVCAWLGNQENYCLIRHFGARFPTVAHKRQPYTSR
ncbi:hypothetical protein TcBrA4_0031230 [Trypanosoma cruzi]|nr:hypothetical protein TcBrA4_0031230 [Trypanosoma cruzi]